MQTKTSTDVIYGFMLVSNYYMPLKITQQIKRKTIGISLVSKIQS